MISRGQSFFIGPFFQEYIPAPVIFGLNIPEFFILTLKHRRAQVTSDSFESFIIERVNFRFLPPQVKKNLKRPPVPYRGDIKLKGICRVLTCFVQISPVP
jgi:hypothetical protein